MKKDNYKRKYVTLILLVIISISAGLSLMFYPEKTSHWIIRGIGLVWFLEGIAYMFDIKLKYLKSKLKNMKNYERLD